MLPWFSAILGTSVGVVDRQLKRDVHQISGLACALDCLVMGMRALQHSAASTGRVGASTAHALLEVQWDLGLGSGTEGGVLLRRPPQEESNGKHVEQTCIAAAAGAGVLAV